MVSFSSLGVVSRGMSRFLVAPMLAARVVMSGVVLAGVAALPAPAMAQSARDAQAEAFVDSNAHRVLAVLNDRHTSIEQRHQAFRVVIGELVDWPHLTRYVLGKYARTATPDQQARFTAAYRTYAEGVYQHRIDDYHANKAVVTGSVVHKPGDVVVITAFSGAEDPQPVDLAWRVLRGADGWKLVDVQVKGVWLAITQQQDFLSTIDNHGGNVDVLINQLVADAAKQVQR
jgi:phospholipid transport system substrate-binding protein